jgi:hypothetical protein
MKDLSLLGYWSAGPGRRFASLRCDLWQKEAWYQVSIPCLNDEFGVEAESH